MGWGSIRHERCLRGSRIHCPFGSVENAWQHSESLAWIWLFVTGLACGGGRNWQIAVVDLKQIGWMVDVGFSVVTGPHKEQSRFYWALTANFLLFVNSQLKWAVDGEVHAFMRELSIEWSCRHDDAFVLKNSDTTRRRIQCGDDILT